MTQSKGYRNPLVGRISQLLDYLAHNEATLQTIVRDLSIPKTSAYVLLQSLLDVGYVRLLPQSKTYALGFKLYEIGIIAAGRINLRDQAMPYLEKLRNTVDLTCHLGCLDGTEAFRLTSDVYWSSSAPDDDNAPFDVDFYILFNLAVGGNYDGGRVPPESFTSGDMEVDYVRVYQ